MSTALENTLKSKITIVVIVLFMLLLFGCGFMSLVIYQGTSKNQEFFNYDVVSAQYNELNEQYKKNKELNKIANTKIYDLTHAYVEVNPYKTSPTSGIIIFTTRDEEQIRVYINDEYATTMNLSKKHIIPIYGLKSDYDNKVKVESSTESHEYILHVDKIQEEVFYDYIELVNGNKIVSIRDSKTNNLYNGFIETDNLGKIYNYYMLKNGYNGSIALLPNGNMVTIGIENDNYIIYTFDPRNGDILNKIDLNESIKNIDNTIDKNKITDNINYYLLYKNNLLYVGNNDLRFVFDITNNKLINVYSSNNIFINTVWEDYNDDELKNIDLRNHTSDKLYDEITENININYLKTINNQDRESLKESNYKKINLENSEEWTNSVSFTDNLFTTDYDLSNKDVDLYLVNRAGKIYILNYLTKDNNLTNRLYNIYLPVGEYALFIKVDNKLYRTNRIYQF